MTSVEAAAKEVARLERAFADAQEAARVAYAELAASLAALFKARDVLRAAKDGARAQAGLRVSGVRYGAKGAAT